MKKAFVFISLITIIFSPTKGDRIITIFDIARWYLDSDLVIVSRVLDIDTMHIRSMDTVGFNDYSIKYDIIKVDYKLCIDSIIKGNSDCDTIMIHTPEFYCNYQEYKITDSINIEVTSNGDTLITALVEVIPDVSDSDFYSRLEIVNKYIIFLKNADVGYEIKYVTLNTSDDFLKFLNEVEMKGDQYFNSFFPPDTLE